MTNFFCIKKIKLNFTLSLYILFSNLNINKLVFLLKFANKF